MKLMNKFLPLALLMALIASCQVQEGEPVSTTSTVSQRTQAPVAEENRQLVAVNLVDDPKGKVLFCFADDLKSKTEVECFASKEEVANDQALELRRRGIIIQRVRVQVIPD